MKAAEEYIKDICVKVDAQNSDGEIEVKYEMVIKENVIEAINKARRECIDECAKVATVTDPYQNGRSIGLRDKWLYSYIKSNPAKVDKQSILSLIDELK